MDIGSPGFHGDHVRSDLASLGSCQGCHGQDLGGGAVEVACATSGCHTESFESCGTCHGSASDPRPMGDAHDAHPGACRNCHPVPEQLLTSTHLDRVIDVRLARVATQGGYEEASWNPDDKSCSGVYCHQGSSPPWTGGIELDCQSCHPSPAAHDRFERVVSDQSCTDCHPGSSAKAHADGNVDIAEPLCATCHGQSGSGAPPPALDGSTSPGHAAVGAHQRHVDATLPGRIGKPVPCVRCHSVPDSVLAPGHLDDQAPADVDVIGGDYDPASGSCVASCHFDSEPVWTDDSGAERACDACHGFPPVTNRDGTRHTPVAGSLPACLECHPYSVSTHVDGQVTLQ